MNYTRIGAVSAFLAVAFGAFGAHGLRGRIAPDLLEVFETGARYQMYHALAMIAVGLAGNRSGAGGRALGVAGAAFLGGSIVFAGSLYTLALTGVRLWGAVTPLGGAAFLVGWVAFAVGARQNA